MVKATATASTINSMTLPTTPTHNREPKTSLPITTKSREIIKFTTDDGPGGSSFTRTDGFQWLRDRFRIPYPTTTSKGSYPTGARLTADGLSEITVVILVCEDLEDREGTV